MAELMTLDEVANYLRVTEKTIYRLLKRRKIPATRVGQRWRFDKASIDRWLHRNTVGAERRILVVDDEETVGSLFKETLEELGHRVTAVLSSSEGLELVKKGGFDLVFLDLKMPTIDGAELFQQIRAIQHQLPVVIITGYPDSQLMARALAEGPFGVMNKPFGESDIVTAATNFLSITQRSQSIKRITV